MLGFKYNMFSNTVRERANSATAALATPQSNFGQRRKEAEHPVPRKSTSSTHQERKDVHSRSHVHTQSFAIIV
jgi:hypothetical protein